MSNFGIEDLLKKGLVELEPGVWGRASKTKQMDKYPQKTIKTPPAQSLRIKKASKPHKYNAKSKDIDGVHYDSTREYDFSKLLKLNKIDYKMKEVFVLQEKFKYCGEAIREIKIIPDYIIFNTKNSMCAVVDIKGMVLPEAKIKFKLLKFYLFKRWLTDIPVFLPSNKKEMQETINELLKLK